MQDIQSEDQEQGHTFSQTHTDSAKKRYYFKHIERDIEGGSQAMAISGTDSTLKERDTTGLNIDLEHFDTQPNNWKSPYKRPNTLRAKGNDNYNEKYFF